MPSDDQPNRAKTVLVVEDNPLNLKLFVDLLDYHGYELITTHFGRAGVELASQKQPDLILLDIQLPDISGIQVAQELKADKATQSIPIIAVTAFAMPGDRQRMLESGCDDYIAKPFNVHALLSMVERYSNTKRSRSEGSS
ncbi:MAG TPA: response regulator [Terriglobales bacterium]